MIENFNFWINLILGVEFIGVGIILMRYYIPTLKNKRYLGVGIILLAGGFIVKMGLLYVNQHLVTWSTIGDRIKTIYNNENTPASFITIGPVESIIWMNYYWD